MKEGGASAPQGVKVIMTTAMNNADVIIEYLNARCNGYIVNRPEEKLLEEIENLRFLPKGG